jgi:ureidoglycolate dehydrogenase (NAD+)
VSQRIPEGILRSFVEKVFERRGIPDQDARTAADVIIAANLLGVDTHGVVRLSHYVRRLENGTIKAEPNITVERPAKAVGIVDGDNGLGHIVTARATDLAAEIAGDVGTASVAIRGSSHFGIAGYYVRKLIESGYAGMATTSSDAFLIPFGATKAFFGTNPIAYGFPASKTPVVLDMATTSIPYGKVVLAQKEGKPIPDNWGFDASGKPTSDPWAITGLHPAAGPKGSGMAMVIDIFSNLFPGTAFGPHIAGMYSEMETPRNLGHFISAWDISAFVPLDSFIERIDSMIEELHDLKPADGFDSVLYPGEIEAIRMQQRKTSGIPIDDGLYQELEELGTRLGVSF